MTTKQKAWTNLFLLLVTLGVNYAGGTGLINDMSQGDVSDRYNTLITPASMTFSIWSVIYGLLLISLIIMLIKHKESYYARAVEELSPLFWVTCVLNMAWIVTFSYLQIGLSSLFILAFVIILSVMVKRIASWGKSRKWLLPLTFGLYTGWLFIATVVNIAAFLVQIGWDGFGIAEHWWAVIVLAAAVIIAGIVWTQLRNVVFLIPIAWAYWGIYVALQESQETIGENFVAYTAIGGIVVILGLAGYAFYRNRFSIVPES